MTAVTMPISMHVEDRSPTLGRATGALALLQIALFLVPMIVLGQAIGWPASLRFPANEVLPLIRANAGAVVIGYGAYLLVSVAMVPLVFAVRAFLAERGQSGWHIDALTFIGAAAGIVKTLGIVRWLSVMPVLAQMHAADPAQRAIIETTYVAMNTYAGAVGELLGVQLLSGIWFAGIGAAFLALGWRVIGIGGVVAGLMFVAVATRVAFPEAAALQGVAVPLVLVWLAILAIATWRAR